MSGKQLYSEIIGLGWGGFFFCFVFKAVFSAGNLPVNFFCGAPPFCPYGAMRRALPLDYFYYCCSLPSWPDLKKCH